LVELIRKAAHPPKPRKPTKADGRLEERRLKDKRSRGQAKAGVRRSDWGLSKSRVCLLQAEDACLAWLS